MWNEIGYSLKSSDNPGAEGNRRLDAYPHGTIDHYFRCLGPDGVDTGERRLNGCLSHQINLASIRAAFTTLTWQNLQLGYNAAVPALSVSHDLGRSSARCELDPQ